MRLGGVTAAPTDGDPDHVGRGHLGSGPEVDLAGRIARRDVDGEGARRSLATGAGGGVEQALLDHRLRPAEPFLAGLEHQDHLARQVRPAIVEQAGRAEEHRDVGVVAAGVHRPVELRREVETGVLAQRQGVHVAAEEDGRAGPAARDDSHDRAERLPRAPLDAEPGELLEDQRLGLREGEPDLRLAVDPPPDRDDIGLDRPGGFEEVGRRGGGTGVEGGFDGGHGRRIPRSRGHLRASYSSGPTTDRRSGTSARSSQP